MRIVRERDRAYGRRLALCGVAALLVHLGGFLLPVPRRRPPELGPGLPTPASGMLLVDVQAPAGPPGAGKEQAGAAPPGPAPLVPEVKLAVAPPVAVPEAAGASPSPPKLAAAAAGAGSSPGEAGSGTSSADTSGGVGGEKGASGGGGEPPEIVLRPRLIVQPRIPAQVVGRKIDDFVLLQNLVGIDGQVRQVRVLHSIPACEDCNRSAVEAAQRYRYDAVLVAGRPAEVWTVPFPVRFSYRYRR